MKKKILLLLFLTTTTKGKYLEKRSWLDPFGIEERFKEVAERFEEGVDRFGKGVDRLGEVAEDIFDPFDVIGSFPGNLLEIALKGPQAVLNALPDPPFNLPAGPYRRGPYAGICTCLGNIGGCYIDAAKPPPTGFTCKCVKEKGILSGKFYGCAGFGYRLSSSEEEHTGELYDRAQCLKGIDSDLPIPRFEGDCGGYYGHFSDYDWGKVQEDVKIRLFAPNSYTPPVHLNPVTGEGHCSIWEQGEDIHCKLRGEESEIGVPRGFDPNFPLKGMIHGFVGDGRFRVDTVPAYNKKFDGEVNVIIVDWSPLARAIDIEDTLDNSLYYRGARNSQIVGEYLGRCLAGLSKQTGLRGQDIHLAGFSLGGQMLGTLGPAYEWWLGHLTGRSEKLGRVTALDPAGPGFVDGDVSADPRLNKARLTPSAATFVDVIHTNSDAKGPVLLNTQNPFAMKWGDHSLLGHMDFYPDGVNGLQNECNPKNPQQLCKIGCSHERAVQYFMDSINKDCVFPASSQTRGVTWDACMGEQAQDNWQEGDPHSVWHTDSSAWLREHRTGLLEDCEYTARYACRIITNIFPGFSDGGVCYKDAGTKCEL